MIPFRTSRQEGDEDFVFSSGQPRYRRACHKSFSHTLTYKIGPDCKIVKKTTYNGEHL